MYLLTEFDVIIDIDDGIGEYFDWLVCIKWHYPTLTGRMTSKDLRDVPNKFGRGRQELVFDFDF